MPEPTPVPDAAEVLASLLPTLDEFTMPCEVCESAGCPDCDDTGWWKAGDVIRNYMALPPASLTPAPGEGLGVREGDLNLMRDILRTVPYHGPRHAGHKVNWSEQRLALVLVGLLTGDPAPHPSDGPEYHADVEAWLSRQTIIDRLTASPAPLPDDEERT